MYYLNKGSPKNKSVVAHHALAWQMSGPWSCFILGEKAGAFYHIPSCINGAERKHVQDNTALCGQ